MLALVCALALSGCRSCSGDDAEKPGPPMPTGMLVPLEAGNVEDAPPPLAAARGIHGPSGVWVELQHDKPGASPDELPTVHWLADSLFVPVTALTGPLHECFARALPGFTLFVAQRFDPNALGRLATELEVYARANADALGAIATEVAKFARTSIETGTAVWISAPSECEVTPRERDHRRHRATEIGRRGPVSISVRRPLRTLRLLRKRRTFSSPTRPARSRAAAAVDSTGEA